MKKFFLFALCLMIATAAAVAQQLTVEQIVAEQQQWASNIANAISNRWARPPGLTSEPLATKVRIEISRDGVLQNVSIVKPSGDARFDDSVLTAIRASAPLPVPVNDASFVGVLLPTFESRALGAGAAQPSVPADGPAAPSGRQGRG